VIAHVGGVPVEELISAAAGTGTAVIAARTWVALRLRRRRESSYEAGRSAGTPLVRERS
jgi:hypothetical protein